MLKRNEEIHPQRNLYMNVNSSNIQESKVETTQMSINREMHFFFLNLLLLTMEYYLVIKRNEVLMNLENIMPSERSQSHKTLYYMIPLI